MGEVYRATDTKLDREVAIKTLSAALVSDKDRLVRFEREAKLLAALNHAHIASVYSLDEHEGTLYIAMELVEGETLDEKLKSGALPIEEALRIALQIAEALEAAHEKGVIHRDLKPANVMVTPNGQIKVLDFGLAKAFSDNPNEASPAHSPALSLAMTQQGLILGTAAYMSPEQASGQATDQRADVWAFGVVLYEMLTGLPLFSGESVPHILAAVLQTEPDWNRLPKNLQPRLRQLLERCLTKKPRQRLHSMADVRIEIETVLEDPRGPIVEESAIAAGRSSWTTWRLAAAAAVAAIAAGLAGWFLRPEPVPDPVVRFPFVLPDDQSFTRPELSMIAVSRDGARLAYVANNQICVRNLSETQARLVDGTYADGLGVASPVFSPDGEWLVYIEISDVGEAALKRVPVSGGTPVTIFSDDFPQSPSWPTPDRIVFALGSGVMRIPANGGAPEVLVARRGGEVLGSPKLLPGGDAVLFARAQSRPGAGALTDDTQIVVQTIGADDRTVVWDGGGAPTYLPSGHLIYAQGSTLFGIPFDMARRALVGGPVPIVEGVRRSSNGISDAAQYDISDTGTLVAIPGGASAQPSTALVLVDRSGIVTPIDVPLAEYHSPRISPNGEHLAVEITDASGLGHIWIYDLSGDSAIRRLTQTGNNRRPIWTRDGERITFGSEREGSWGIFERPADGSALAERLTSAAEGHRHYPESWSPDGQTLAYTDADLDNNDWDIWTLSRATGDTQLLAGGQANQFLADFSPDGQWLAYSTSRQMGIEVVPFPTTGVVHRMTDGVIGPVWTATGDEMFFRSAAGGPTRLMALEVATAGGITFRNLQTLPVKGIQALGGYRDFDITPDGERLVMVLPHDPGASGDARLTRIDVVVNWQQELLTRVPLP